MTTVSHTLDPKNPSRMSREEKKQFDALRDEDIDYSDIPELDADFWANAEIEQPAQKPQVTMRVDAETLDYFKGENPKGYTARMASVLKAYVKAHQPKQG